MTPEEFSLEMQDIPESDESVELQKGFNYFFKLRSKGTYLWKNDEFPAPAIKRKGFKGGRRANGTELRYATPNREFALDVNGICKHQRGRRIEIEWKRRSEYEYIMRHWDELRTYRGNMAKDHKARLANQVRHCEMINDHGGFAMFAWFWTQVQQEFLREGIDPG
jgi:hypothetical protein